jgi:hypothetical protein
MSFSVAFNLSDEKGMLGKNSGIDNAKYFVAGNSSSQKYRGQQRILQPKNIPAEKNRKGILDAELLFERLHGKLPSRMYIDI